MRPAKEALEAEYKRLGTQEAVGKLYGVRVTTVSRWFKELGVKARRHVVQPERRRGGRKYKQHGKRPQHVTPAMASAMRAARRDHPEWTLMEVRDSSGATCTKSMVRLILQDKRLVYPAAYPDGRIPSKPTVPTSMPTTPIRSSPEPSAEPKTRLTFGSRR